MTNSNGLVGGIIVGVVIGVTAGLLLSPKSGRENREYIRGKVGHIIERIRAKRRAGKSPEEAEAEVEEEFTGVI